MVRSCGWSLVFRRLEFNCSLFLHTSLVTCGGPTSLCLLLRFFFLYYYFLFLFCFLFKGSIIGSNFGSYRFAVLYGCIGSIGVFITPCIDNGD